MAWESPLGYTTTLRHTTFRRTSLDEWSARRRDLSTWQHTTLTFMPPVGFESAVSANKRQQTQVLDRAATEIGFFLN